MELTPRTLVLALGACLVGGLAFGVVTTFAPGSSNAAADAAGTASPSASADPLGDEEATMTVPASLPNPTATPSPSREPAPTLAPSVPPSTGASPTPTTSASPVPTAPRKARTTAKSTSAKAAPRSGPAAVPAATTPRRTRVIGGWQAPALHRGVNALSVPRLTSGAQVSITVGCSPSAACQVSGSQLAVGDAAASVTVTWSAPARGGFGAWRVSRSLG